ncbi:MAG: glycosyltransferase family 4 protein [Candidatus Bathyarchaeia archaeon]
MSLQILCDIITSLNGSVRPAAYLAEDLVKMGCDVTIISPVITPEAEEEINKMGIKTINLNTKHFSDASSSSVLWLETWIYEALFKTNSKRIEKNRPAAINFSHVVFAPTTFWYLQGPPSTALRDISSQLPKNLKLAYDITKLLIEYLDRKTIGRAKSLTTYFIANSKFCASMYTKFGIKVHSVIYPPLDRKIFHPTTRKPREDYVLTYFGKETKFSVIKKIANMGVKIRAFGSKTSTIDKSLLKNPNIEFLGRIPTADLVNMYSNALYTLFPFTHEPFGYIPLESMACGTPTLTYSIQGPGEYIVDGENGWLAKDDEKLIQKAIEIWKNGYPKEVRKQCAENAKKFDRKNYFNKWLNLLKSFNII